MSNDGVWVKVWPESGDASIPAVIGGENGASVERGKTIDGTVYDIYTFTDDTATDLSLTVETAGLVDALIVGGGGSGGNGEPTWLAGGGGAGGVVEGSFYLDANSHKVIVGAGGTGVPHQNLNMGGYNGKSSHLSYVVAVGGGAGAGGYNGGSEMGGSGGPQSKPGSYAFPKKGPAG